MVPGLDPHSDRMSEASQQWEATTSADRNRTNNNKHGNNTMICSVTASETNNDRSQAQNSVREYFIAVEQMDQVNEMAKKLLAGFPYTTTRAVSEWQNGHHTTVIRPLTFSMQHVSDLVSERITPLLCAGLLRGEPSALSSVQQIINEAAREIAFDALDLSSNQFIDYESLKLVAEHGDDH